jgi:hypothetical protein
MLQRILTSPDRTEIPIGQRSGGKRPAGCPVPKFSGGCTNSNELDRLATDFDQFAAISPSYPCSRVRCRHLRPDTPRFPG